MTVVKTLSLEIYNIERCLELYNESGENITPRSEGATVGVIIKAGESRLQLPVDFVLYQICIRYLDIYWVSHIST